MCAHVQFKQISCHQTTHHFRIIRLYLCECYLFCLNNVYLDFRSPPRAFIFQFDFDPKQANPSIHIWLRWIWWAAYRNCTICLVECYIVLPISVRKYTFTKWNLSGHRISSVIRDFVLISKCLWIYAIGFTSSNLCSCFRCLDSWCVCVCVCVTCNMRIYYFGWKNESVTYKSFI